MRAMSCAILRGASFPRRYINTLMSATNSRKARSQQRGTRAIDRVVDGPRADDPRVVRTRAAVIDAARTLFLRQGYAGTTMDDIAALAGLTKRTLYNNYPDKSALFVQIAADAIAYAERFAHGLHEEFTIGITAANLRAKLNELGESLALGIARP